MTLAHNLVRLAVELVATALVLAAVVMVVVFGPLVFQLIEGSML